MVRIADVAGRRATLLRSFLNPVVRRIVGAGMAPPRTMAQAPEDHLPDLASLQVVPGRPALDPAVRALAVQLVASMSGRAGRTALGRCASAPEGLTVDKLLAVQEYAADPRFLPDERAALGYAAAVAEVGARIPDEVFAELRRHFSHRDIVDLTVAVATETLHNRISAPLGIEARRFCAAPALRAVTAGAA